MATDEFTIRFEVLLRFLESTYVTFKERAYERANVILLTMVANNGVLHCLTNSYQRVKCCKAKEVWRENKDGGEVQCNGLLYRCRQSNSISAITSLRSPTPAEALPDDIRLDDKALLEKDFLEEGQLDVSLFDELLPNGDFLSSGLTDDKRFADKLRADGDNLSNGLSEESCL
uniref:Uncharacterized protein n=1 Tax=Oryza nivara TaxID=4536 RepID=A0A0E0GL16_ORYNI